MEAVWQRAPFVTPRHSSLARMPSPIISINQAEAPADASAATLAAHLARHDLTARIERSSADHADIPTDHSVDRSRRGSRSDRHGRLRPFAPARAHFGRRYARNASIHDRTNANVALTVAPLSAFNQSLRLLRTPRCGTFCSRACFQTSARGHSRVAEPWVLVSIRGILISDRPILAI